MKRSEFMGSLLALVVAAAIKDASILKLNNPAKAVLLDDALPGIGGQVFKIRLHRSWLRNGDVIAIGNDQKRFLFTDDKQGAFLHRISNQGEKSYKPIEVEFHDDEAERYRMEEQARKICSCQIIDDLPEQGAQIYLADTAIVSTSVVKIL
jgi:hypothetical protein